MLTSESTGKINKLWSIHVQIIENYTAMGMHQFNLCVAIELDLDKTM